MFIQKLITIENQSKKIEQKILGFHEKYNDTLLNAVTKEDFNALKKKVSTLLRLNKHSRTALGNMQNDVLALPASYELFARLLAAKQQLTQLNDQIKTLSHSIDEKIKQVSPQPKKKQSFFSSVSKPTFVSLEKYIPKLPTIAEHS